MGLDNPLHLAFLLVILLLVFGAKRLPEMGRSLGDGLRGFKQSINGEPAGVDEPPAASSLVAEQAVMHGAEDGDTVTLAAKERRSAPLLS